MSLNNEYTEKDENDLAVRKEMYWLTEEEQQGEADREKEFIRHLFQGVRVPWGTYLLTGICVFLFLAMLLASGGESFIKPSGTLLIDFGANYYPKTGSGQWFRLITCAFVHIGIIHLLFNMFVLLQAGRLVERLFGHTLFLSVYLGSAITGSLLSLAVHPDALSAGASGAIFGIFGALIAYYVRFARSVPKRIFDGIIKSAFIFVAINLLFGLQPGIDNFAHLGGLAGGFLFGLTAALPVDPVLKRKVFPARLILTLLLIGSVAGGSVAVLGRSDSHQNTVLFNEYVHLYIDKEHSALLEYNEAVKKIHHGEISSGQFVEILREKIIPLWREIEKKSGEVSVQDLSKDQKELFEILGRHCGLWISVCQKTCSGLENNSEDLIREANAEMTKINMENQSLFEKEKKRKNRK